MKKFILRAAFGVACVLSSLVSHAATLTLSTGASKTFSFNNFGYYQSYDLVVYPNMPLQYSFFLKGAATNFSGTKIKVSIYEDSDQDPMLFAYTHTFTTLSPDFGVTQVLGNADLPLWTDLQGVLQIEVTEGVLAFDLLEASTTFISPVNANFLVNYKTGDILRSTPAPMPISPTVDKSDPQVDNGANSGTTTGVRNQIPEPGMLALMLGAGFCAAMGRNRKRSQTAI